MADHVIKLMKETEDFSAKEDLFFSFLKAVSHEEYDFFDSKYISMNRQQKHDFIENVEKEGIYIHQAPFFGNTTEEEFKQIFVNHPEWCTEYKFIGIEKPMTMGDIYFIRLKHEASNKTNLVSTAALNVKNLPSKSTLKKEKKSIYSRNPLRVGEMEVSNLMIAKNPEIVEKFLKTYSTNEKLREETVLQLLNPGNGENGREKNNLDMDIDVDLKNNKSTSREILDKYLNLLGYEIIDNQEGGENA